MVDSVLNRGGIRLDALDGFAVTLGPGSFTGLRIGVSLIKGFVLATEKPFVGINTLEALACTVDAPQHPVCPTLDARKSEVYAAIYETRNNSLSEVTSESALSPEALCELIKTPTLFTGTGSERYRDLFKNSLGKCFLEPEIPPRFSTAAGAALLASSRLDTHKQFDLSQLKINYIRKSEAELSLGR
jgi:tRNA threonylcarbamoyladenosine biosynthesis protein TsaB